LGGAIRIPVASLTAGDELFDAELHGPGVLGGDANPEVLLSFVSAGPARDIVREDNRESCAFDLVAKLTIKGKSIQVEAPARAALLPFAQATQLFSPSDLFMLRTEFSFSLADVGISSTSRLGKGFSGDTVKVGLYVMCTTIHPEVNFDPRVNPDLYVKQLAFMTKLRDFRDPVNAYIQGRAFMKEIWNDSRMLNDLAISVLTDEGVKRRDLAFVEEAARRANALTDHKDPQYLNTLALVCYERGDLDEALKWSRKAVDNLAGQPFFVGPPIRAALQGYEAEAAAREKAAKPPPSPSSQPAE
jgi:hypothetical protein